MLHVQHSIAYIFGTCTGSAFVDDELLFLFRLNGSHLPPADPPVLLFLEIGVSPRMLLH